MSPKQTKASAIPFTRPRIGRPSSPVSCFVYELRDPGYDEYDSDLQDEESESSSESESEGEDMAHSMDMDTHNSTKSVDKGKGRATDSPPKRHHRVKRPKAPRAEQLRPILTIQRSHGFVWNQELFVPQYAKDRYKTSTCPPTSEAFAASSWSSSTSSNTDYGVDVVEIRLNERDLEGIVPS